MMNGKKFLIVTSITLVFIIPIIIYTITGLLNNNVTNLEEYKMIPENERLLYKKIDYKNNKYLLVGFKGNNPTYTDNVILLEKKL